MERIWKASSSTEPQYDESQRTAWFNGACGSGGDPECPVCRGKGLIMRIDELGYRVVRDCDCRAGVLGRARLARSGLGAALVGKTFDSFEVTAPWQRKMKDLAAEYAAGDGGWLVLCGQSGCGKTHLCAAVCAALMDRGRDVVYAIWRDEAAAIKADLEGREKRLDRLRRACALYLDDLFKGGKGHDGAVRVSQADVGIAFDVLNYRAVNGLPTVISTELSPRELLDIDEAVAGRILEQGGRFVFTVQPDRRKNRRLHTDAS